MAPELRRRTRVAWGFGHTEFPHGFGGNCPQLHTAPLPMLLGCHHIELNVCDLDRSFEFYSLLSLHFSGSRVERGDGWFQWQFAGLYLHFNQVAARFAEPAYHRKRVGLDHLAFKLDTMDAVNKLDVFLRMSSIPILYPAAMYGPSYYAIYFEDPDRIKLEFGADIA